MIAIFDLDGTLTLTEHRQHFLKEKPKNWKAFHEACVGDLPNVPVIKVCRRFSHVGLVFILSGRSEDVRRQTESWLTFHSVPYTELCMRRSGDHRDDRIVKTEMWDDLKRKMIARANLTADKGLIADQIIIFDDRQKVVDMWREMGLVCCQVAPGDF